MPSPLKKIQDLVYQGMVLDEHGTWIPLAEKLRKEKVFLRHLERGEILVDGVWCKLADLPQLSDELDETRDVRHPAIKYPSAQQPPEVPTSAERETPEETVSFSTETLRDFNLPKAPAPEDDFAPETKVFSIVRPSQPQPPPSDRTTVPDAMADQIVSGETQAFLIPGLQTPPPAPRQGSVNPKMEYQETVLYNTRLLKKSQSPESAPASKVPVPATVKPAVIPRNVEHDDDDHLLRKRSPPFWVIMLLGIAGIVVLAALWLLL